MQLNCNCNMAHRGTHRLCLSSSSLGISDGRSIISRPISPDLSRCFASLLYKLRTCCIRSSFGPLPPPRRQSSASLSRRLSMIFPARSRQPGISQSDISILKLHLDDATPSFPDRELRQASSSLARRISLSSPRSFFIFHFNSRHAQSSRIFLARA